MTEVVKIKIVNSGSLKEVDDKAICWNKGRQMRIVNADIGDLIFLTNADQKDTVAEVLGKS